MRFSTASTLLALAAAASATSWGFSDGTVTVASKTADDVVEHFTDTERVAKAVTLGHEDSVKVSLTTKEGSTAKRPHQAFLVLRDPASGLEAPFPLAMKESGRGSVKITQRDLPVQLLLSKAPLETRLILGSLGSARGSVTPVCHVALKLDVNSPTPSYEAPLRYGPLPEIHHIFRADPKNPPKLVSLVFALAVLATVPALLVGWLALGANVSHVPKALGSAPLSHAVFFGSVVAMEVVFFLYYRGWSLFQTLPAMGAVGVAAFLSGTKALGEVQRRREAGER